MDRGGLSMRQKYSVTGLLGICFMLVLISFYIHEQSAPRWKRVFPIYNLRSSKYRNIQRLARNIWGVDEKTFLKSPFYDGKCESHEDYRFKQVKSPWAVGTEVFDIDALPNLSLDSYYTKIQENYCLTSETNDKSQLFNGSCICNQSNVTTNGIFHSQYIGPHCDIPGSVWKIHGGDQSGLNSFRLRHVPRRAVVGMVVDHELEMTEIRVRQLHKVVDLFVILESSVTTGGDPKPLYFLDAFQKGFLCEFQHKILYVFMDHFPNGYVEDGWLADGHLRNEMSLSSIERIKNLKDEDLFFSFDADEIPKEEVILFLRFHDGFYNPVQFNLRWTLFKYYWQHTQDGETMTRIVGACTMDFLKEVCEGNVITMRKKFYFGGDKWENYKGAKGYVPFEIGVPGDYSGHHCSWCTSPEGISIKLRSAVRQDFPRWGDYPEKLKIDFLKDVSDNGLWFDGSQPASFVDRRTDPDFAPRFVLSESNHFRHLLEKNESKFAATETVPNQ